jgi:hypothetical protein
LNFAGDYLGSAKTLANASGAAAPIVHLAWQATENDFKALSVGYSMPFTHNPGQLVNYLRDNNLLSSNDITQLSADAAIVSGSRTHNAARYPESDSFWSSLPRQEITNVVFAAERIHHFAEAKISSAKNSNQNRT